jgi:hypothetical protein
VLFELYFALRELVPAILAIVPKEKLEDLRLPNYYKCGGRGKQPMAVGACLSPTRCAAGFFFGHRWFEKFVAYWLRLAKINGEKWIKNSLLLDPLKPSEDRCYSTSAIDVFRAFQEIIEFWERLKWPGSAMG